MTEETLIPATPDAQFRFSLSEDGMKLGVNRYFPPSGGEEPSVDLLKRQVAAAGVDLPVDEDAARRVIDAIRHHGEVRRITLVHGIPAREPRDGSLSALGNLEHPVFPGDRFARLRPADEPRSGRTIDGRILKPKQHFKPESVAVTLGENVTYDPVDDAYVAQIWGLARLRDGVLRVDPLAHVSEDAVTVTATLHATDFKGQPVTTERLEKELRDLGVVIGIDTGRLNRLLERARRDNEPLPCQVIACGRYPVPGRDGWLEYLVRTRETTGTLDQYGRLDFRDRGAFPMVRPEQDVARLHPPTLGEGGIDIYGKTIPANAGHELRIHPGENLTLLDDNATFRAEAVGVVVMERGVLAVTECLVIHGDVDLESGNVNVEKGSVKITGNVLAGFKVSAPKHVFVGGSVESATVTAGGNVEVAGGILMPEGGRIIAGGDVIANYATNAVIRAEGDVIVANDVTNSLIRAGGSFTATRGQGIVQGGAVLAARGVEVNEVGSDLGVPTVVGILTEREEETLLERERLANQQAVRKIDDALGNDPSEVILARTSLDKYAAVADLLAHRHALTGRLEEITRTLNHLALARQAELAGIQVRIRRFLFPGATIRIGIRTRTFSARAETATLFWDHETRDIIVR